MSSEKNVRPKRDFATREDLRRIEDKIDKRFETFETKLDKISPMVWKAIGGGYVVVFLAGLAISFLSKKLGV